MQTSASEANGCLFIARHDARSDVGDMAGAGVVRVSERVRAVLAVATTSTVVSVWLVMLASTPVDRGTVAPKVGAGDGHLGVKLASTRVNVSHLAQYAASPTIVERNLGTGVCNYFDVVCIWSIRACHRSH